LLPRAKLACNLLQGCAELLDTELANILFLIVIAGLSKLRERWKMISGMHAQLND